MDKSVGCGHTPMHRDKRSEYGQQFRAGPVCEDKSVGTKTSGNCVGTKV